MKKHFSVFLLMARYMLWPTLIVTALGAGASVFMLSRELEKMGYMQSTLLDGAVFSFYGGLALLYILLLLPMRGQGGVHPRYTLRRLGVSELTSYIWQAAASAMALFIYTAGQAAALAGYSLYLQSADGSLAGNMTAIVLLYSSGISHGIMPLSDWPVYFQLIAELFALGCGAAYFSFKSRTGKIAVSPFVLLAAAVFSMAMYTDVGDYIHVGLFTGFSLFISALFIYGVYYRSNNLDEEDIVDYSGGVSREG